MKTSKVSIVVTTRNEAKNIENCLRSICEQTYPEIELIVVDNNSEDSTKELSRKFTNLVFNHGPERSAQRNFGLLEVAKGEYGMYIDADMILTPNLVELCVESMHGSKNAGLYIREIVLGKSIFAKVRRFERQFYDGTVIDAARFFRLSAFSATQGFDESIFSSGSGEDWDLDKRIKSFGEIGFPKSDSEKFDVTPPWLLLFAKTNGVNLLNNYHGILHNESEIQLRQYLLKKRYYAKGFNGYIQKWGNKDHDIKKQFGFAYRFILVFLEDRKWRIFLSHPGYAVATLSLKMLVGVSTLSLLRSKFTLRDHKTFEIE